MSETEKDTICEQNLSISKLFYVKYIALNIIKIKFRDKISFSLDSRQVA